MEINLDWRRQQEYEENLIKFGNQIQQLCESDNLGGCWGWDLARNGEACRDISSSLDCLMSTSSRTENTSGEDDEISKICRNICNFSDGKGNQSRAEESWSFFHGLSSSVPSVQLQSSSSTATESVKMAVQSRSSASDSHGISNCNKRRRLDFTSSNINFQKASSSSSSGDEPDSEAIAQMKEMIYRAAAFRPVNFGSESVDKPKRKNVKISKDPQTVAARQRRERISEKIRVLQTLVPGGCKMDTASMLDEAANYLKFLRSQIKALESCGQTSNAALSLAFAPFINYYSFGISQQPQFSFHGQNMIHQPDN